MQGEHSSQNSFFGMIYEDLIPADHLLRKLSAAVDFSFVSDLVRDCYCPDNGRPSWDPLGEKGPKSSGSGSSRLLPHHLPPDSFRIGS